MGKRASKKNDERNNIYKLQYNTNDSPQNDNNISQTFSFHFFIVKALSYFWQKQSFFGAL